MANYVLVHGGDRDGSIWNETATLLRSQGHHVICPSMKSVKIAALQENIQQVADEIEKNNMQQVILIGHSYGAFVITGVADQHPDKINMLVYVDSLVPKNGKSLFGMMKELCSRIHRSLPLFFLGCRFCHNFKFKAQCLPNWHSTDYHRPL